MRWFDATLFMGNGEHSKSEVRFLRRRLNEALSILSGRQQGAVGPEYDKIDEREDIVRDIAAAVLGKSIAIGDDLPYPGVLDNDRVLSVKNAKRR